MKKNIQLISLAFFLLLFNSSCNKKTDDPYHLKFKLNNEWIEFSDELFSIGISFSKLANENVFRASLTSFLKNENPAISMLRNNFLIEVFDGAAIKEGIEYSLNQPIDWGGNTNGKVQFRYTDKNGVTYNAIVYNEVGETDPVLNEAYILFEKITDKTVKGKFRGVLLRSDNESESISITEGEFEVPINRVDAVLL